MKTTSTYTVIGQLGDEADHEFGEYDSLKMAKDVCKAHDGIDGVVRVIDTETRAVVFECE